MCAHALEAGARSLASRRLLEPPVPNWLRFVRHLAQSVEHITDDVCFERSCRTQDGAAHEPRCWREASLNTGQLACFAEDDDRVSDRHGRLGPAAMVGTFELVAAHLAFHRTRVGTQPPLGDPLSNDLGDRAPDRPGDLVRGETPRGWPGDDARSAACPQTTAGRGPSPRPGRPGASAGGS